jgi:hypothetical protein
MIAANWLMTISTLRFNMSECSITNVRPPFEKNKELVGILDFGIGKLGNCNFQISQSAIPKSNNSRLSELYILLIHSCRDFVADVITDQFPDSGSEIEVK